MFVSLEGIDGSGKTTQARLLAEALRARGHPVTLTREPGGSPGAEEIRRLVLTGEPGRWSAETEILLFTAARRDHLERTIAPALARGEVVVCDRFADSTRVYQGALRDDVPAGAGSGSGRRREAIDALHRLMIGREPDLTLVIDLDPAEGLARALARRGSEGRFEEMGEAMQRRMRAGFLALAAEFPGRVRVIDGARPAADVAAEVLALALAALAARR